jgi:hypothetical protein
MARKEDTMWRGSAGWITAAALTGCLVPTCAGAGTVTPGAFLLAPSISIGGASLNEGDTSLSTASFAVVLSAASGDTVTVHYQTSDGTANSGSDYQSTSGELSFAPGQTLRNIDVSVYGDLVHEIDESFAVDLSDPTNATIASSHAEGVIVNDDTPPTLHIDDVSIAEGQSGTCQVLFTVYLSVKSELEVRVDYATADGSATAGSDYQSASGNLTFPPFQEMLNETQAIAVTIKGDTVPEGDETFFVDLSGPSNATLANTQGVGLIEDDEGLGEIPVTATWQVAQQGVRGALRGSAANDSVSLLVGDLGDIWVSTDTLSWVKAINPDPEHRRLYAVTQGGGQFVAVGSRRVTTWRSPVVLTSSDGFNWSEQTCCEDVATSLYGVTHGGGQYVAAGYGGAVVTSPDGATWTEQSSGVGQHLRSVAYGNGLYAAVGNGRTVITSPDGITWTPQAVPGEIVSCLTAIIHSGTQFVIVAAHPTMARDSGAGIITSPDGVTWTQQTVPSNQPLHGVTVGDGLIVAVGNPAPASWADGSVLTSTDGVSWTRRQLVFPLGVNPNLITVTYGPQGFVAGGNYFGSVFSSRDGVTPWVSRTLEASRYFRGVAHNGTVYCAIGAFGAIASSPDGVSWSNQTPAFLDPAIYRSWGDIVVADGLFTVVGLSEAIITSPDCATWTLVHPGTPLTATEATHMLRHVTYGSDPHGNGLWVAVGDDYTVPGETLTRILTSTDGITWTGQSVPVPEGKTTMRVQGLTHGNGLFLMSSESYDRSVYFYTSPDGSTWTLYDAPFYEPGYEDINEVSFGDGRFVAVADRIRSSDNGSDWTMRLDFPPEPGTWLGRDYLLGATYGNGRFYAVGNPGAIYVSADGATWARNTPVTSHQLVGVTASASSNRAVAVGASSIIFADFSPTISIDDISVSEGDSGITLASFTVTLSAASAETVRVNYQTVDGTAAAGGDYLAASDLLLLAPGTTSQMIDVQVTGDTVGEQDENFFVELSDAENASIRRGRGKGMIENDDDLSIFADGFESGDTSAWSQAIS